MKATCIFDGEEYDAALGFLLLSRREREEVQEQVGAPDDPRALAAACAAFVAGATAEEARRYVESQEEQHWEGVLDATSIETRLAYDSFFEGPERNAPGFRRFELLVLDRERKLFRQPRRIARTIVSERTRRAGAPRLFLDRTDLPAGTRLSQLITGSRPNEPLIVAGDVAYPVSSAWLILPNDTTSVYAKSVATWMREHWPEALDVCGADRENDDLSVLDGPSTMLAAEAYCRGMSLPEAAEFILDARSYELELNR